MKKSLFFIAFFVFFSLIGFSQSKKNIPDKRLYEVYSSDEINRMLNSDLKQLEYLNYYLDNCYYVVSLNNSQKPIEGIDIKLVTDKKTGKNFNEKTYLKGNFNVLKYNFNTGDTYALTYVWKEAGIAIVFRPEKHIKEDFEKKYNSK